MPMDVLRHYRDKKWVPLYVSYLEGFMRKDMNLGDLFDTAEARATLGLIGTVTTHDHDDRYPLKNVMIAEDARLNKKIDDNKILTDEAIAKLEGKLDTQINEFKQQFKTMIAEYRNQLDDLLNSAKNKKPSIPIGSIIIWSAFEDLNDTDWLLCDGRAVDASSYPILRRMMANTPDYRGVFLRGLGAVQSTHWGTVIHSSAGLNELQGDTIRNIWGKHRTDDETTYGGIGAPVEGAFYSKRINAKGYDATSKFDLDFGEHRMIFDASRVVPTSNENRPVNKAVRYYIKGR